MLDRGEAEPKLLGARSALVRRFAHVGLIWLMWVSSGLADGAGAPVERLEISGLARTRAATIEELLPRRPPASFTEEERYELARRIAALAIFDSVDVEIRERVLQVRVREKWTLIPNFAFTTGKAAEDLRAEVGVEEYNLGGRATRAVLNFVREQRGYGFLASASEHPYRLGRWAWGGETRYRAVSYRFPSAGLAWTSWIGRGSLWASSPPVLNPYTRFSLIAASQHENVLPATPAAPQPDALSFQVGVGISYDAYHFHDLVPHGVNATLSLFAGASVREPAPRHSAELAVKIALPFTSRVVALMHLDAAVASRGNPHASFLLGSIGGVRGLPDGLYRNWAQTLVNAELRYAVKLLSRLALQGVAFADGAWFEPMTAQGTRDHHVWAASAGLGIRLVPTFVSNAVLRFDLARLLVPERAWFPQLAFTQHF